MMSKPNKIYLDAQDLLEDSFRLAAMIKHSDFAPSFMIAVWRGGVPMGIAVQEYLAFHGILTDHISVRTASYTGIDNQAREIKVFGLSYLVKKLRHEDSLLIVDDVFDTGRSVQAIIDQLSSQTRLNMPHDVRIAVPYYKPKRNQIGRRPDFYLHETEDWLKYPHSLEGLSTDEMKLYRPEIYEILKKHLG